MILHVRPIGLLTGIGVERGVGTWGASRSIVFIVFELPATPLGGSEPGPRMRRAMAIGDNNDNNDRNIK